MTGFVLVLAVVTAGRGATVQPKPGVDLRCGAYCLYVALKALERPVGSFEAFEKELGGPSAMGYSMEQLARAAESHGAYSLGVQTSLAHLESRPGRFACIALLERDGHFVCIYDIDDRSVFVVDPPEYRVVARDAFERLWPGKAVLISNSVISPLSRFRIRPWAIAGGCTLAGVVGLVAVVYARRRRASRGLRP